jgi:3-hydroxymyristoyl/3-hydroxydecanoyl-(acyl carrier protein) dehydratase
MVTAAQCDDVIEVASSAVDDGRMDTRTFVLRIPPNLEYFEGHFDGDPIVAAVVQLDVIVVPRIEAAWPDLGTIERATKMKFRSPIRPHEEVTLSLSRRLERSAVDVRMLKNGVECASGTLFFRAKVAP